MTPRDKLQLICATIDAMPNAACVASDKIMHANRPFDELVACLPTSRDAPLHEVFDEFDESRQRRWSATRTRGGVEVEVWCETLPASPLRIVSARPAALSERLLVRALEARDDERRRVARELHDETGQWLTTLIVGLQSAESRVADAATARELSRLRDVTQTTVNELRRLCRGLHPGTLEKLGLFAGLGSLADDFSTAHRVATTLDLAVLRDMPRLGPRTELAIFRLVQEALTNAAKHADARSVALQASRTPTHLVIEVVDDGNGFDLRGVRPGSLGLAGMRERAANIRGRFEVVTAPGRGTTIRLLVPHPQKGAA